MCAGMEEEQGNETATVQNIGEGSDSCHYHRAVLNINAILL